MQEACSWLPTAKTQSPTSPKGATCEPIHWQSARYIMTVVKATRHVNATKSYLHFGLFVDAVVCSIFFVFHCF